ncbi:MAG: DNA-directed RNA polymerase subunit omega [Pyramidobacter sp.]|jgi:DNA-directed RNA polymerase subunit K/omega
MEFHNIERIMDNVKVNNKYLLTTIISERARQISEEHGTNPIQAKHPTLKAVSLALTDLEEGNVTVQLQNETIPDAIEKEIESEDASLGTKKEDDSAGAPSAEAEK